MKADVEKVLDVVRGSLVMHGGNIEVVDVEPDTGIVQVRFQGACVGCPLSEMTFKAGIEETLLEMLPEVKQIIQVV
ncbi:MAG: NifU family protein [Candidatus Uhrbacteria bacterium]